MPRWDKIDFSNLNIIEYNLRLILYVHDKFVAIIFFPL